MLQSLLILASAVAASGMAADPDQSVQAKNGEFIFSKYPPRALAAGEQGAVRFRAEVNEKGIVLGCKVTASSGFERLDRETCDEAIEHLIDEPGEIDAWFICGPGPMMDAAEGALLDNEFGGYAGVKNGGDVDGDEIGVIGAGDREQAGIRVKDSGEQAAIFQIVEVHECLLRGGHAPAQAEPRFPPGDADIA